VDADDSILPAQRRRDRLLLRRIGVADQKLGLGRPLIELARTDRRAIAARPRRGELVAPSAAMMSCRARDRQAPSDP
jgi:hypothetical protein